MDTNEQKARDAFSEAFPLAKNIEVHTFQLAYQAGKVAYRVKDERGNLIKFFPDMIEFYTDYGTKKEKKIFTMFASAAAAVGNLYKDEEAFRS